MQFQTIKEKDFWAYQIKQDNKAIQRINRAGRKGDMKEIMRAEKQWRKDEARDRRNFNREN